MKAFPGPCIRRSFVVFPLLLLWLSATALANDYYVSPSGNDSNVGSQASPWATIQHAVNSFSNDSNGTVIHVTAGAYASGITINRGGASKSSRLVLQCDPGLASATAAIGKCRITGSSTGIMITGNNIDVVGFDIGGNPNMNIGVVTVNQGSGVASTGGNSTHVIRKLHPRPGRQCERAERGWLPAAGRHPDAKPAWPHHDRPTSAKKSGTSLRQWSGTPWVQSGAWHLHFRSGRNCTK